MVKEQEQTAFEKKFGYEIPVDKLCKQKTHSGQNRNNHSANAYIVLFIAKNQKKHKRGKQPVKKLHQPLEFYRPLIMYFANIHLYTKDIGI